MPDGGRDRSVTLGSTIVTQSSPDSIEDLAHPKTPVASRATKGVTGPRREIVILPEMKVAPGETTPRS